jgi:hypothetical protein
MAIEIGSKILILKELLIHASVYNFHHLHLMFEITIMFIMVLILLPKHERTDVWRILISYYIKKYANKDIRKKDKYGLAKYMSDGTKVMPQIFLRKCNSSNNEIYMDESYIFCSYEAIFTVSIILTHFCQRWVRSWIPASWNSLPRLRSTSRAVQGNF